MTTYSGSVVFDPAGNLCLAGKFRRIPPQGLSSRTGGFIRLFFLLIAVRHTLAVDPVPGVWVPQIVKPGT
ncbi:MAG TPA: hypothetical protein VMF10_15775 [Candidatus Aquilonibacter sp.]|nr:hypothetical protein [Candidatus Aquilonibacter sp.]